MKNKNLILPLTLAFAIGFVNPALAAEVEKEIDKNSEGVLVSEIGDNPKQKVLPAAETNKDTLNFMELVDYFTIAEKIPTSRWDTPANVYVITSEEIEANHYHDLKEILDTVNGVFLGTILNSSSRIVILMDGHKRISGYSPSVKSIERIEILKGGGSALYGADAVGGVINIITKKGERHETTVDLSAGSWSTRIFEITNQGKDNKFGWFIDGRIAKSKPYHYNSSDAPTMQDSSSDNDLKEVNMKLTQNVDDRSSLMMTYRHQNNKQNAYGHSTGMWTDVDETDVLTPYTIDNRLSQKENNFLIAYNFKEGTDTPGYFRYFNDYFSEIGLDSIDFSSTTSDMRYQGFDYQNGWEFGNHKLIAGFEWHKTNHSSYYWYNKTKKMVNTAYYIQDTISLNKKWTLIPGVRLDHNSEFGNKWSPKVAVNYRAGEKTKIYASWGKVYRAPTTTERYNHMYYYDFYGELYFIDGSDMRLTPETGHVETIGFEHDFDDKTRLTASIFNAKLSNLINYEDTTADVVDLATGDITATGIPSRLYKNSDSSTKYRGFELNFNKQINDNWSYQIGYSLLHRKSSLGNQWTMSEYRVPRNSYKIAINFRDGGFKANLLGIFGTGSDNSEFALKRHAVLDFNTSYDVTDWGTVYLKFCNFTNQNYSYFEPGFHSPGRSFMAGITCKF